MSIDTTGWIDYEDGDHNYAHQEVPEIVAITYVRFGRSRGTDVRFANGVVLKFTSKLDGPYAAEQATRQYRNLLAAGYTEAEIMTRFVQEVK